MFAGDEADGLPADDESARIWVEVGVRPERVLKFGRKANFCGTRIDAAQGALIVDVPSNGYWDARGYVGKGVLHMNDFWFFAENVVANALVRAAAWRGRRGNSVSAQ